MAVGSLSGREGGWTLLDEENQGGEIMVDRGSGDKGGENGHTLTEVEEWGRSSAVFLVKAEREMDKWVVKEKEIPYSPG